MDWLAFAYQIEADGFYEAITASCVPILSLTPSSIAGGRRRTTQTTFETSLSPPTSWTNLYSSGIAGPEEGGHVGNVDGRVADFELLRERW